MKIVYAKLRDLDELIRLDRHINPQELRYSIGRNRVYLAKEEDLTLGWLRYNLFWDNTPFVNMLYVLAPYRGRGVGTALMRHWETKMLEFDFQTLMTSTSSEETAQHFYVKLGYRAAGGMRIEPEPYELIFCKRLKRS